MKTVYSSYSNPPAEVLVISLDSTLIISIILCQALFRCHYFPEKPAVAADISHLLDYDRAIFADLFPIKPSQTAKFIGAHSPLRHMCYTARQ